MKQGKEQSQGDGRAGWSEGRRSAPRHTNQAMREGRGHSSCPLTAPLQGPDLCGRKGRMFSLMHTQG